MAKAKPPEDLAYEQAFAELGAIVVRLESGDLPLEEALGLFERGQALAARCGELLESAQLKLRQLAPGEEGGMIEVEEDLLAE
ncbi:MAG TPA: exodeoxyribonuclease VII small subunit [Anaerolineales bacterium]|nr:exodeoxyribonuclease VII small subunit [Anaerolineales bacterium]